MALTSIALASVWGLLYFAPALVRSLPEVKILPKSEIDSLVRWVTVIYCAWNIAGCYFAAILARYAGYRKAFSILLGCSMLTYIFGFRDIRTLDQARFWLNTAFFFSSGIFALFPLYVPPLFPTLLRTTGAGFSYNIGRVIAGIATIVLAFSTAKVSPGHAIWMAGFLYFPGVILALFIPVPAHEVAQSISVTETA